MAAATENVGTLLLYLFFSGEMLTLNHTAVVDRLHTRRFAVYIYESDDCGKARDD